MKRTQQVVEPFGLPVMIHMGQSPSSLRELLPLLKPGDIVTHLFAPPPNAIVDDDGRLLPEVLAARRRGIVFDVGNGVRDHIRWDIVEQIMRPGLLARHVLDRLERHEPHDGRRRLSELHVEALRLRHVGLATPSPARR